MYIESWLTINLLDELVQDGRLVMDEGIAMKLKKFINRIKPPCAKCPYKLGLIETPINPCPQCKRNDYDSYEWFLKLPWQGINSKDSDK